nr:carboxymuconolactone decarboxylase family protein [Sphingomonas sp. CDS-1]
MDQNDTSPPIGSARSMIGHIAPKLAELSDDVLFGDVWERAELSKRDRSLITVAALTALYRTNELPFHIKRALENGVRKDELIETFTHLAFYAGWPAGVTAVRLAEEVFKAEADR